MRECAAQNQSSWSNFQSAKHSKLTRPTRPSEPSKCTLRSLVNHLHSNACIHAGLQSLASLTWGSQTCNCSISCIMTFFSIPIRSSEASPNFEAHTMTFPFLKGDPQDFLCYLSSGLCTKASMRESLKDDELILHVLVYTSFP